MTIPFAKSIQRFIPRRPRRIGLALAGAFIAWTAFIGYTYFISVPPSETDIASQSVQLNAAQLQTVTEHLTSYRQNLEIPALPDGVLASPKP